MASSILAGFVKGFADRELDLIDERRKQEAKLKEAELLARLQSETRRADALFEESLPSKVLGRKRTEQEINLAEKSAGLEERKFALDEMDTKERLKLARQREAREAAEGRERTAALRAKKSLDSTATSEFDVGEEFMKDPEFAPLIDRITSQVDIELPESERPAAKARIKDELMRAAAAAARAGGRASPKSDIQLRTARSHFKNYITSSGLLK